MFEHACNGHSLIIKAVKTIESLPNMNAWRFPCFFIATHLKQKLLIIKFRNTLIMQSEVANLDVFRMNNNPARKC